MEDLSKLEQFGFQPMGNFTPEDVFVIGYPKSGNTLLQHILAHLVFGLRADTPKTLINSCVTEYYNNPKFFRYNQRHFFKSHERPNEQYKNVIYIVRDGRAAVRSHYYMMRFLNKDCSLKQLYADGGSTFVGTWVDHVKEWSENKYNANILYVKYEELLEDKMNELSRICNFLNIFRTPLELQNVVDATSLENMKQMESDYSWKRMKTFKNWKEEGRFVREGKTAGHSMDDQIEPEWIEKFEEISASMLKEYNYLS